MEDLVVKSIRFSPEDWRRIDRAATAYNMEPSVFVRRVVLKKLQELATDIERRLSKPQDLPF